jgi:hypothetical protein
MMYQFVEARPLLPFFGGRVGCRVRTAATRGLSSPFAFTIDGIARRGFLPAKVFLSAVICSAFQFHRIPNSVISGVPAFRSARLTT